MSNYSKATNFATKDALPTGDLNKVIKGTEIDDEFEALETHVSTKADLASPAFTGTPTAPTAGASNNSTRIATTAMVQAALGRSDIIDTDQLVDDAVTTDKIANSAITPDQLATNAVTNSKIADDSVGTAILKDNSITAAKLKVADNGTAGQVLTSDGDGTFSWTNNGDFIWSLR